MVVLVSTVQQNESAHINTLCVHVIRFSCVRLLAIPWTVAQQATLSRGFSRQGPGVGCRVLLQGIFPTQGSNPCLISPALAGRFFTTSATCEVHINIYALPFGLPSRSGHRRAVSRVCPSSDDILPLTRVTTSATVSSPFPACHALMLIQAKVPVTEIAY